MQNGLMEGSRGADLILEDLKGGDLKPFLRGTKTVGYEKVTVKNPFYSLLGGSVPILSRVIFFLVVLFSRVLVFSGSFFGGCSKFFGCAGFCGCPGVMGEG